MADSGGRHDPSTQPANEPHPDTESLSTALRSALFGDAPMEEWPRLDLPPSDEPLSSRAMDGQPEPWRSFIHARSAYEADDTMTAIEQWQAITAMPGLESRHYLQAWHFLRQYDILPPPDQAKNVLGVIIEVALPQGLDVLACYRDRTARYFNYAGSGLIWDRPDQRLDTYIETMLERAQQLVQRIGPWGQPRLTTLDRGLVRLNMLTPSGLHFGQGPLQAMGSDPMGGPLLEAGTRLLQAITELPHA